MRWEIIGYDADDGVEDEIGAAFNIVAVIVGSLDVAGWLGLSFMALMSAATDPTVKGFGVSSAWWITALFLVTGAPGLALASVGRAPRPALVMAGAFPVAFMVVYGVLSILY